MNVRSKKGGDHGGGGHGGAGWVITFADLMALLMALFVMIVSFSNQDEQKLHDAVGSMKDAFGVQTIYRPAGMIEKDGLPTRKFPLSVRSVTLDNASEFADTSDDRYETQSPEVRSSSFATRSDTREASFLTAAASLRQALQDLPDFAELSRQVLVEELPDGLHISLTDQDGRAMFAAGSREPTDRIRVVLGRIAPVIEAMNGGVKVLGHTEAGPSPSIPGGPNWQLAADRATTVARILGEYGLSADHLREVSGVADRDPLYADDPFLSANRRVEIVIVDEPPPLPGSDLF
jgi:chemotaxis protein MotB